MSRSGSIVALLLSSAWLAPAVVHAQSDFDGCVGRLRERAVSAGVTPATAERALAGVSRLERVIRSDRNQPEFVSTFADYYGRRVTESRIERGRALLAEHRDALARLTARYGVPGQYIVALWGLETNFGSYLGDVSVFDSLSTLACDERRSEYFSEQLVDALRIVDRGDAEPEQMIGSWAGAMGQTQFMPDKYLRHAVDGDGDGRADLWGSALDALASGANLLGSLGWRTGFRWGREVLLPEGFDYAAVGLDEPRALSAWRSLGLRDTGGLPLAGLDIEAALLVPAGHAGPKFIVYENFDVLMRWNRSEHFAISVGRLADRIAGAGPLANAPPDDVRLTREQVRRVQRRLNALGYDSGTPDGMPGPATRAAVWAYERDTGRVADGFVDADLLEALEVD